MIRLRRGFSSATSTIREICPSVAPLTAVDFCYGWFLVVFQTWIPNYFIQNYGLNLAKTALFSTCVLLAGVIGDTLGGLLSDAVLHRTGNIVLARPAGVGEVGAVDATPQRVRAQHRLRVFGEVAVHRDDR